MSDATQPPADADADNQDDGVNDPLTQTEADAPREESPEGKPE